MATAAFPHAYPFRFVDTVSQRPDAGSNEGRVRIRVSANARAAMGEGWQSPLLCAEAIAQAALLIEGADAESGRRGYLVGIQALSLERAPRAGETLEVAVRLHGRFGAMLRFDGEVRAEDGLVAHGSVLVRKGDAAAKAEP